MPSRTGKCVWNGQIVKEEQEPGTGLARDQIDLFVHNIHNLT